MKPNRADIAQSREVMEAQLRAYIGRNTVLEDDAFYHSIYPIDNVMVAAMEWFKQLEQNAAANEAEVAEGAEAAEAAKQEETKNKE